MQVTADNISFTSQSRRIIQRINLHAKAGQVVGIIGPNGSGKTTLLKTIYRQYQPSKGIVWLGQHNVHQLKPRQAAQTMAVVSQDMHLPAGFSVLDAVLMGRAPHQKLLEVNSAQDEQQALHILEQVGLADRAYDDVEQLSGGEKQRIVLARALVQNARVLILDEPNNNLDIYYQLQMLAQVQALGKTVLITLHDLNLAARYCDWLYVLNAGQVVAQGQPQDVLTPALLKNVFRITAEVSQHPKTGRPHIVYLA